MWPASWDDRVWRGRAGFRSSLPPGHQYRLKPILGRIHFRTLYGGGRINIFRAYHAAFSNKGAVPDAVVVADHTTLLFALIARIHVVAIAESDGCRAQKLRLQPVHRASRVAEHTVNALGELVERLEFRRRLQVFASSDGFFLLSYDPGLYTLPFV